MKNRTQYYHGTTAKDNFYEFTLAVNVPTKEELKLDVWKLLGDNIKDMKLTTGYTKVHPNDQYSKKIGRDLSSSRMVETVFKLENVTITEGIKYLYLKSNDIGLTLEIKDGREKVHLINAGIQ